MGLRVAAVPLEPLEGLEGVYTHEVLAEAVTRALAGPVPNQDEAIARHGWGERLGRLLGALEIELPEPGVPVRIEAHPVKRYPFEARVLP